jgi:hypothetical protein
VKYDRSPNPASAAMALIRPAGVAGIAQPPVGHVEALRENELAVRCRMAVSDTIGAGRA